MEILKTKASELSVGQFLLFVVLAAFAAFVVGTIVKDAVTTNNLVVSPSGNSFVHPTYFGPMSKAAYDKYAAAKDKAIADAATAAAKKG